MKLVSLWRPGAAARMLGCALGILFGAVGARAATLYVWTNSPSMDPPYTNGWASAAHDIQSAIDQAANGDTVWVTNGTYVLTNQINIVGKYVTLQSVNGQDATIIDGNYPLATNRCLYVNTAGTVVDGFTIQNGCPAASESAKHGGGIYLYVNGGIVRNCTVINCRTFPEGGTVTGNGGGIALGAESDRGSGIIEHCVITGNVARIGGGIGFFFRACTVQWCRVEGNLAHAGGLRSGGIEARMQYAGSVIQNCSIVGNKGPTGGGISLTRSGGSTLNLTTVRNCIVASNVADGVSTYGQYGGGGIHINAGGGTVENCLIYSNVCIGYLPWGGGLMIDKETAATVRNCTIVQNEADQGGGIYLNINCTAQVVNVAMDLNRARSGAPVGHGIYVWNGNTDYSSTFTNCSLQAQPTIPVATNELCLIGVDNRFVSTNAGNFRLSASPRSPCFNAGLTQDWMADALDLDGNPRLSPAGGPVDIGCYESLFSSGSLIKAR